MGRKALGRLFTGITVFGLVAATLPFIVALAPSQAVLAARPQHDLSTLAPGSYRIDDYAKADRWFQKLLILRDWDGTVHAFLIPGDDEGVLMPERFWGFGNYTCRDFRPDTDPAGRLVPGGLIRCHDREIAQWGLQQWRWRYSGQADDEWIEDMWEPSHEVRADSLYLNR